MPAYDYKCPACENVFEITRGIRDADVVTCPECATQAKHIYSPVGIVFKGTGFHNTDYRKKEPASADSKSEATGVTETKAETKAEKPAPCGGGSSPACSSCAAAE